MKCDICGTNCKKNGFYCDNEYATFFANWGFDSKRDLLQMKLIMCEDCSFIVEDFIKRLGGKFKYNEFSPPHVFEGKLAKFYEDKDLQYHVR